MRSFSQVGDADLFLAIGGFGVRGDMRLEVTVHERSRLDAEGFPVETWLEVAHANVSGVLTDFYDFDFGDPDEISEGAILQAGYGTLGVGGHVFSMEAHLDHAVGGLVGYRV